MIFTPQKYAIEDIASEPFIDSNEIRTILDSVGSTPLSEIELIISKSMERKRLSMHETAVLLQSSSPQALELILETARKLKKEVYGERIVLFAPLYIGNKCTNNCSYCGFRASNQQAVRKTLSHEEIESEVKELEKTGHKRLIMVYGEHPLYDPAYIADTVTTAYNTHSQSDKINRININAAPFDVDGFRTIKEADIGTYQIFQETYDPIAYEKFHLSGRKRDYYYRLTALDRAMQAGIDDVGLGVLLGLGDWKFEVMALIRHTNHLEACFGVGPHTISFPRIKRASNIDEGLINPISDDDFIKLVAVLRLAVPYTGLILTAREPEHLRNQLIEYGVSQIDAGSNLEIGGYSDKSEKQDIHKEQFELGDTRSLEQTIDTLIDMGQIPSFCTACYRKGRTGEHFMEFSTKGFIKRFCTPNAILTFAEYLEDHAGAEVKEKGWKLISTKLEGVTPKDQQHLSDSLDRVKNGDRDLLE